MSLVAPVQEWSFPSWGSEVDRQPLAVSCPLPGDLCPVSARREQGQALGAAPPLPFICVFGPSPRPCTPCSGENLARLSHAGTPEEPEDVQSFPKAPSVPGWKPPGCSRLAELFTFLRTMSCIP